MPVTYAVPVVNKKAVPVKKVVKKAVPVKKVVKKAVPVKKGTYAQSFVDLLMLSISKLC